MNVQKFKGIARIIAKDMLMIRILIFKDDGKTGRHRTLGPGLVGGPFKDGQPAATWALKFPMYGRFTVSIFTKVNDMWSSYLAFHFHCTPLPEWIPKNASLSQYGYSTT